MGKADAKPGKIDVFLVNLLSEALGLSAIKALVMNFRVVPWQIAFYDINIHQSFRLVQSMWHIDEGFLVNEGTTTLINSFGLTVDDLICLKSMCQKDKIIHIKIILFSKVLSFIYLY